MPILAIEDDAAFAELLKFWLAPRQIRIAQTMQEASAMIAEQAPEVVLLDLALPDSPPDETIRRIEEIQRSANNATVIVITGNTYKVNPPADVRMFHKDAPGFFEAIDRSLMELLDSPKRASEPAQKVADEVRRLIDPST